MIRLLRVCLCEKLLGNFDAAGVGACRAAAAAATAAGVGVGAHTS